MAVHPDLVGPPAMQNAVDEADLVAETKRREILRFRGAAWRRAMLIRWRCRRMTRDGFPMTPEDCCARFRQRARCRSPSWGARQTGWIDRDGGLRPFSSRREPRWFPVQTMDNSGTFLHRCPKDSGSAQGGRSPGRMRLMPRRPVHDNAALKRKNEEIVVLENNVELYLLGGNVDLLEFRFPHGSRRQCGPGPRGRGGSLRSTNPGAD